MATDVIESLGIELTSNATKANKAIDSLDARLAKLAKSLGSIHTTQITSAISGLGSQTQQVDKSTKTLSNSFDSFGKTSTRTKGKVKSLASTFGSLYANFFWVIRGANQLGKAIESSMDYVETYNYFNVTMDKIGKEWNKDYKKWGYDTAEAYAESFQSRIQALNKKMTGYQLGEQGEAVYTGEKNLGLDVEQMMNYQASIGAVTNSLGLMGEVSVNTQKAMSMLAADLSSFKNIDLSSVMTNLQSGLIGQSRALYKYGIDITNATMQTYAYELGLSKAVSEMTQAEKMQLRVLMILNQSKVAWGDQANTLNSVANQYRILKQQFGNLARTIGNLFLPIVEKVLPVVNGLVIALNELLQAFGISLWGENWLTDIMTGTSAGYTDDSLEQLEDDATGASNALKDASKNAEKLKNNLLGVDKLNIISPKDDSDSDKDKGSTIDLSKQIASAVSDYEKVWEKAFKRSENLAQKYAKRITKAFGSGDWESVGAYWSNKLSETLKNIPWENVYKNAENFGENLAEFLNGFITPNTFATVGTTIAKSLNTSIYTALSFAETFSWENLGESIGAGITAFFEDYDFTELALTMNTWANGIYTTLWKAFTNINWITIGKGIFDFLGELEPQTVVLIVAAKRFKNLAKSIGMSGILSTTTKKLAGFINEFEGLPGISQKAQYGIARLSGKFTDLKNNLTLTQKGLLGILGTWTEFKLISSAVKGLTKGTENLGVAIVKVVTGITVAFTTLRLAGLFNPATIGITALIGGFSVLYGWIKGTKEQEEERIELLGKLTPEQEKFAEKVNDSYKSYKQLNEERQKSFDNINAEYDSTQKLAKELDTIVDKNGKIKKGYEDRAKVILTQINEALGTEYSVVDGQIEKYKELEKQVKKTIAQKRLNALIDANEDAFVEAQKNQRQAYKDYKTAKKTYELQKSQTGSKELEIKRAKELLKTYEKQGAMGLVEEQRNKVFTLEKEYDSLSGKLKKHEETLTKAEEKYIGYRATIENQNKAITASVTGNAKEQEEAANNLSKNLITAETGTINTLIKQRNEAYEYWQQLKEDSKDKNLKITKEELNEAKKAYEKADEEFNEFLKQSGENSKSQAKTNGKGIVEGTVSGMSPSEKQKNKAIKYGEDTAEAFTSGAIAKLTTSKEKFQKIISSLFSGDLQLSFENVQKDINKRMPQLKSGTYLDKYKVGANFTPKTYTPGKYATGGFPEDGFFFANHTELVGKFSNGKTAVANNKQITDGIEEAAYRGYMRAMASQIGSFNNKPQRIEIPVVFNGREIARIVNEENSRNGEQILGYESGY